MEYEGTGFKPEVPDYLGYVLGLMLIWLAYTGYSSVVGMIRSPDSTISKIVVQTKGMKKTAVEKGTLMKEKVVTVVETQIADTKTKVEEQLPDTTGARLSEDLSYDAEQGWFWSQLNRVNTMIGSISASTSEYLQAWFVEDEELDESSLIPQGDGDTAQDRHAIEYF